MIWQGWDLLVRPLITGTVACCASSMRSSWFWARIMMPSTKRDRTFAVSAIVSPRPSCMSPAEMSSDSPPSCRMPTSKETRVRVEGRWKISAMIFPASRAVVSCVPLLRPARPAFIAFASLRMMRKSAPSKSERSRKCLGAPLITSSLQGCGRSFQAC